MLANDSVDVTPGAGAAIATHAVGGKEHSVLTLTNEGGVLTSQPDVYIIYGLSAIDVFNKSGSGKTVKLLSASVVLIGSDPLTSAIANEYVLRRTHTIVGESPFSGDAFNGTPVTSLLSSRVAKVNPASPVLPALVVAGSASITLGQIISKRDMRSNATAADPYMLPTGGFATPILFPVYDEAPIVIGEGSGINLANEIVAYSPIFQAVFSVE